MALVLYDLDNTLLAGDSERAWCEFLIDIGVLEGDCFRLENERLYKAYLTQVMEKTLAHVEMEPNRTRDVLGSLQAGMAPHEYVVSELARSRGLAGLEELKERLRAAGYDTTADKLLEGPPGGGMGRPRQRDPAVDGRGAGAHRLGLCADIFLP